MIVGLEGLALYLGAIVGAAIGTTPTTPTTPPVCERWTRFTVALEGRGLLGSTELSEAPPHALEAGLSARPSRSNAASSRAQRDRILAMTPRERVALALALGRRSAELARRRAQTEASEQ